MILVGYYESQTWPKQKKTYHGEMQSHNLIEVLGANSAGFNAGGGIVDGTSRIKISISFHNTIE
jgi:hypothetical protein